MIYDNKTGDERCRKKLQRDRLLSLFSKMLKQRKIIMISVSLILGIFLIGFRPISGLVLEQQGFHLISKAAVTAESSNSGIACLNGELEEIQAVEWVNRAVSLLNKALTYRPNNAHLHYRLGQAYCYAGDYQEAVALLSESYHLRSSNYLSSLELGFALERTCPPSGYCENGYNTEAAWKTAGVTSGAVIANGDRARKNKKFDEAIKWYERAQILGTDLRSLIAYTKYEEAINLGNEEESREWLEKAVEIDSGWLDDRNRFFGWYRLGRLLYSQGNYPRSESILEQAIDKYPGNGWGVEYYSEAYRLLGIAIARQDRINEGLEYLEYSVEVNPLNTWAYLSYGVYLYLSDHSLKYQAESEFSEALRLAEGNQYVWASIITFWQRQEEWDQVKNLCSLAEETEVIFDDLSVCP